MELQIRGLPKRYSGGGQALAKVTLAIPQGRYGLLGPSGAGKSTLMRTQATRQAPDEGLLHQKYRVRLSGHGGGRGVEPVEVGA